jgi:hypothetical protein
MNRSTSTAKAIEESRRRFPSGKKFRVGWATLEVRRRGDIARTLRLYNPEQQMGILEAVATEMVDFISKEPKVPKPKNRNRIYIRGFGPAWRVSGKRDPAPGVVRLTPRLHGRRKSQRLSEHWRVERRGNRIYISNPTTYMRFVQGDRQTAQHKRTGWRTVGAAITHGRQVMRRLQRELLRLGKRMETTHITPARRLNGPRIRSYNIGGR